MLARSLATVARRASSRHASTLVLAEHSDGQLNPATLAAVMAATQIGGPVSVLVSGSDTDTVCQQAAAVMGVDTVLHANDASLDHSVAENVTKLIEETQA